MMINNLVYAGPEYFDREYPEDSANDKDSPNANEMVYAGPDPGVSRNTRLRTARVYAGPPVFRRREDSESNAMREVYAGPPMSIRRNAEESDGFENGTSQNGSLSNNSAINDRIFTGSEKEVNRHNKICNRCSRKISLEASYCDMCGNKFDSDKLTFCNNCGMGINSDEPICPNCGMIFGINRQAYPNNRTEEI